MMQAVHCDLQLQMLLLRSPRYVLVGAVAIWWVDASAGRRRWPAAAGHVTRFQRQVQYSVHAACVNPFRNNLKHLLSGDQAYM